MAIERIVQSTPDASEPEELDLEITLRPKRFTEYIGQERLKTNLQLAIDAAKKRGEPIDHVLLYGPPGLGKTTMASVIANEMGANIRITAGPAIERAGDLASILTNLQGFQARYHDWQRSGGSKCTARLAEIYRHRRNDTNRSTCSAPA
jgi:Holliday junction DNA helicase RuvB